MFLDESARFNSVGGKKDRKMYTKVWTFEVSAEFD
jgi:hypothetical protein